MTTTKVRVYRIDGEKHTHKAGNIQVTQSGELVVVSPDPEQPSAIYAEGVWAAAEDLEYACDPEPADG